jgi:hypothetical protein
MYSTEKQHRSTKADVLAAKGMLISGMSPIAVHQLTGVCLATCYYMRKHFTRKDDSTQEERLTDFNKTATPEPMILNLQPAEKISDIRINGKPVADMYGGDLSDNSPAPKIDFIDVPKIPHRLKLLIGPVSVSHVPVEINAVLSSIKALGVDKVNILITSK